MFLFLFAIPAISFGQPVTPTDEGDPKASNTQKEQQVTKPLKPSPAASPPTGEKPKITTQATKPASDQNDSSDSINRFLVGLGKWLSDVVDSPINLFTALLTVFTILLWNETKKTAEATRKNAEAAKENADAALLQANSLKRSERARIFIEVTFEGMNNTESNGNFPTATIKAINHGKTAASITGIRSYLIAQETLPTQVPNRAEGDKAIPDGVAIAPTRDYEFRPGCKLETFKAADEWNLGVVWYCVGKLDYTDIFDEAHTTGFCWECMQKETGSGFRFCVDSDLNCQT